MTFTQPNAFTPVGSVPLGAGRWGHLDLGGSRNEFWLDDADTSQSSLGTLPLPCFDCAELRPDLEGVRLAGDTGFNAPAGDVQNQEADVQFDFDMESGEALGVRCARDAQ